MPKIYTTVGLYPNGNWKCNGVHEEHIETHIEYNKSYRPGRTLFVDGEMVYKGLGISQETIRTFMETDLPKIKIDKCTAPYH